MINDFHEINKQIIHLIFEIIFAHEIKIYLNK